MSPSVLLREVLGLHWLEDLGRVRQDLKSYRNPTDSDDSHSALSQLRQFVSRPAVQEEAMLEESLWSSAELSQSHTLLSNSLHEVSP